MLGFAGLVLELSLNIFDWRPQLSLPTVLALALYLAALYASVLLHRVTRGPLPIASAAAVTCALLGLGLARLLPDTLSPGDLLGRSIGSPAAYRVLFAAAAALPAVLLVARRWRVDEADAWFARAKRWRLPIGALATALLVSGLVGRQINDPERYVEAKEVLGGKNPVLDLVGVLFSVFTTHKQPTPDPASEARRSLEAFFAGSAVPESIKAEVRAACGQDIAAQPLRAHDCAHKTLYQGKLRLEERRMAFTWLALAAFPIGGVALAFAWRGRRPALSRSTKTGASAAS